MNTTPIFLTQIAIALLAGILAARYLKSALIGILLDLCGTAERADFWWRTSSILLLGLPLLLVLFLGDPGNDLSAALRNAARLSLVGVLLAVGLLSRRIWKHIPPPAALPQPPANAGQNGEAIPCAS